MDIKVTEKVKCYSSLVEAIEAEVPPNTNPNSTLQETTGLEDITEDSRIIICKFDHLGKVWRLEGDSKVAEVCYILRNLKKGIEILEVTETDSAFKLDLKAEHKNSLEAALGRTVKFYAYSRFTAEDRRILGKPPIRRKKHEENIKIDSALIDNLKDLFIKKYTGTKKPGPHYRNFVNAILRDLPQAIKDLEEIKFMI